MPDSLSSSLTSRRVLRSSMRAAGGGTSWHTTSPSSSSSSLVEERCRSSGEPAPGSGTAPSGPGPVPVPVPGPVPGEAGGAVARQRHSAIFPSMSRVLRFDPLSGYCGTNSSFFKRVLYNTLYFIFVTKHELY